MEHSYISHDHELALDNENVLSSECSETEQLDKSSSTNCDSLVDIDADPSPNKVAVLAKHKALLLTRSEEKFTVLWFCFSNDDIKYYTGFQSYSAICFFTIFNQNVIFFTMWAQEILLMANHMKLLQKGDHLGHYHPWKNSSLPWCVSAQVFQRGLLQIYTICQRDIYQKLSIHEFCSCVID